jgi:phosphonate transport system substrate-binding protein
MAPNSHAREMSFAVHPFLSAVELQERFTPLLKYLRARTGIPMKLEICSSYADLQKKCAAEEVDFAFMGPTLYALCSEDNPNLHLLGVVEGEVSGLRGAIVVRDDSALDNLRDLRHKRFAFTSLQSTMGFQVPAHMLAETGIELGDLDGYAFVGNHANVAYAVLAGRFDAGAVKYEVFEHMQPHGLRLLAKTPIVADHPILATARVEKRLRARVKKELHSIHTNEIGREVLKGLRPDLVRIAPVEDGDYAAVRNYIRDVRHSLRSLSEE